MRPRGQRCERRRHDGPAQSTRGQFHMQQKIELLTGSGPSPRSASSASQPRSRPPPPCASPPPAADTLHGSSAHKCTHIESHTRTRTRTHKLYSECQLRSITCSPPSRSPASPAHPACLPLADANSAGSPRRPPTCRTAQPQSLRQRVDGHTAARSMSQNSALTRRPELSPNGALG